MFRRPLRRAAALSLGALLAFAGTAAADSVFADADNLTVMVDGSKFLGDVAPGGTVSADVRFVLVCAGLEHIDPNQSVVLTSGANIAPLDGAVVSVSEATLDPLTTPWAGDTQGCPDPVPSQEGGALSHVVLRAPTTIGTHSFTIMWTRALTPTGVNDGSAFSRTPSSVSFSVRVVENTPPPNTAPTLTVPSSFSVEGDTLGGWGSSWSVSAVDAEDDPDPTPSCSPAAGEVLAVGTTTVTCTVTDSAGSTTTDDFDVTVTDATAPTFRGVPSDIDVTTSDPAGRIVTFDTPTAIDIVDGSRSVSCSHQSGDVFTVGTTDVTCTASDEHGNQGRASFHITVRYLAPPPQHEASAVWLEPVATDSSTFVANRGRTIPVKVQLFVDGEARSSGDAVLGLTPCAGGTTRELPLTWSGGRWNVSLDTSSLAASCYTVGASIDGLVAGSFTLELRGDEAARAAAKRAAPSVTSASISPDRRGKATGKTR